MTGLDELIFRELAVQLPAPVADFAGTIALKFPNSNGVLFYGSCLRTGKYGDGLLDFYLLVDDYHAAYGKRLLAWGNRLLPPNVYYAEQSSIDGQTLQCKYAVMTMSDFERWCSPAEVSPYVWARFAQPSAIAWSRDDIARKKMHLAAVAATKTLILETAPALSYPCSLKEFWSQAFALTYSTEFRAERAGKGMELFDLFEDRYTALTPFVIKDCNLPLRIESGQVICSAIWPDAKILSSWGLRAMRGRFQHVLRLIKAAFTFDGGIDYLAWKITRHSGQPVVITDWQRRHPILGSLGLFFQLKRRGSIR